MKVISNKVFSECYQILMMLDEETKAKIPSSIWSLLELNSDKNLYFDYNEAVSLEQQPIERETKTLLISIYRDYLCDEEIKQVINEMLSKNTKSEISSETTSIQKDSSQLEKVNLIVSDETSIIDLINLKYESTAKKELVVIENKSLISKIFAKIKKLFKRQKVGEDNII